MDISPEIEQSALEVCPRSGHTTAAPIAEFVYPEQEFLECLASFGITRDRCGPEQVVELKRNCGATVSYRFLVKRLERFRFIEAEAFQGVQFQKLEEQIHGLPIYKQDWFKRYRARKAQAS